MLNAKKQGNAAKFQVGGRSDGVMDVIGQIACLRGWGQAALTCGKQQILTGWMMDAQIREMVLADYDAVVALWESTPGVDIRPMTDGRDGIERLLARNPGLSVVAVNDRELVGCALASHDGRCGFLQHVVVAPASRGQGVARAMIDTCIEHLREHHLGWVHLDVVVDNEAAMAFWEKAGWHPVDTLTRLSRAL